MVIILRYFLFICLCANWEVLWLCRRQVVSWSRKFGSGEWWCLQNVAIRPVFWRCGY